jgi:hypothetical protein
VEAVISSLPSTRPEDSFIILFTDPLEPDEINQLHQTLFLEDPFQYCYLSYSCFSLVYLPFSFSTENLLAFIISPMQLHVP